MHLNDLEILSKADEKTLFLQRKLTDCQEALDTERSKQVDRSAEKALEKQVDHLQIELSDRDALISALTAQISSLESMVGESQLLDDDSEVLRKQLDQAKEQIEDLDEKVFYLQRKLTDREEELHSTLKELEDFIEGFDN